MNHRKNSIVFQPGNIGSLQLKNRLVRSATFENAASETGGVTDILLEIYRNLAKGGVGLITTGIFSVYAKSLMPGQIRVDSDDCLPELRKIPKAVHELDPDCKVMVQLQHWGRQVLDGDKADNVLGYLPPVLLKHLQQSSAPAHEAAEPHSKTEPVAPSAILDTLLQQTPRELTLEEIEDIIDHFAEAIRRVQEAGFDGVQLHGAHGYLLSSFLSPHTNKRSDIYGGTTENRVRIVKEIHDRARKRVGADFPILIKFNTTDFCPGGTDPEEALNVGKLLADIGFSALETSGGMWEAVTHGEDSLGFKAVLLPESRTGIVRRNQQAYFRQAAKAIKSQVDVPIILVGGLRSFDLIEEILTSGDADFTALSRPLIRQPDLPNLWLTGKGKNTADCISCNGCLPMTEPLQCRSKKVA